jgi:hypothetical protein
MRTHLSQTIVTIPDSDVPSSTHKLADDDDDAELAPLDFATVGAGVGATPNPAGSGRAFTVPLEGSCSSRRPSSSAPPAGNATTTVFEYITTKATAVATATARVGAIITVDVLQRTKVYHSCWITVGAPISISAQPTCVPPLLAPFERLGARDNNQQMTCVCLHALLHDGM